MTDCWSFLLQTLTASGAAILLLVVKAMLRDKLPPSWQFAAWGILAIVLLLPAGFGGRYVLFNWPWIVETLKTLWTDHYSKTVVLAPFPMPCLTLPTNFPEWLYTGYVFGAFFLLTRYVVLYVGLRLTLRRGVPAGEERTSQVRRVAERYGLPTCRCVEAAGLSSAFVCGVLRPVLVLPDGVAVDDKVILHELLHLKQHDTVWGVLIALLRCLHWCNPLLWYCANRAGNDLEARCDQRVLELLEGEERRSYGRILLSMADEKYVRVPGASSMTNSGANLRRRVEAIARFKHYPKGMGMVSRCVLLTLMAPMLFGSQAASVWQNRGSDFNILGFSASLASARTTLCTTYAGAFDAYAKAVLTGNGMFRILCAPLETQDALAKEMRSRREATGSGSDTDWESGLPGEANRANGYRVYNLRPAGENAYEGLLAVELGFYPGAGEGRDDGIWLACQNVRAEWEQNRWVAIPLEPFQAVFVKGWEELPFGACEELPGWRYEDTSGVFTVRLLYQTTCWMDDNYVPHDQLTSYSSTLWDIPWPHGVFTACRANYAIYTIYTGETAGKADIHQIGVSCTPFSWAEGRPSLQNPGGGGNSTGSSNTGEQWGSQEVSGNWEDVLWIAGGGHGSSSTGPEVIDRPEVFASDLYLNGKRVAELTLLPMEGENLYGT